nr:FGGY-family carbohydrate kinase [Frondihabitans sp. VKM Ac-2883]
MVGAIGADLHHGELLNSTGTTEGLLFSHDAPSLDDASAMAMLANGISCIGSDFTLFASIPTGGSAFATLQSMLGLPITELNLILEDLHHRYLAGDIVLENIPLVLPQFRGSPPPTKRAAARGMIAGLQTDVAVDDIVFGCFLGMVVQFRDVLELFPMQPDRIKVIGPASKNPLWLQLKADLLGTPLSVSQFPEVVSRGAQALASETRSDWDGCKPFEVLPDETRHGALAHWYADVRPLWEHMKAAPV